MAEAERLRQNPEDSSSGKTFKQLYKLGDPLGRGAFSEVKEATHRQSGKSFAIKIVNTYRLTPDDMIALRQEIACLREIRHHPNILDLYDVFWNGDYSYLVTEKITGGSLCERLHNRGTYIEPEAKLACLSMFEALAVTHEHKVAHRDLKLENLLLAGPNDDCNIKIIDYGFAKKVQSENGLKTLIGTPQYVAPCILEGVGYGTKADVWSMGIVVYCILCGYQPFSDRDRQKLFRKIRKGKFEFPEEDWGHISSDAKDFISLLLTVNPKNRPTARVAMEHRWVKAESSVEIDATNADLQTYGKIRDEHNGSPVSTLDSIDGMAASN